MLRAVDDFCSNRHWMMHVGPEKGSMLREELMSSARRFMRESTDAVDSAVSTPAPVGAEVGEGRSGTRSRRGEVLGERRYVCVELGTYCGYSSVLMASTLRSAFRGRGGSPAAAGLDVEWSVCTVEADPALSAVAGRIADLAGAGDRVDRVVVPIEASTGETAEELPELIAGTIESRRR